MRLVLGALMAFVVLPVPAEGYVAGGASWPGRPAVITYSNATPYKAEVRQAAQAWNRSGANVRFVSAPRGRARLPIVYGSAMGGWLYGNDLGFASIGFQAVNRVRLNRSSPEDRGIVMALVAAHEFGHVLGLDHERRRCATMNAPFLAKCGTRLPCSLLAPDDVRGAVALYGGRVRRTSDLCPGPPSRLTVADDPAGSVVTATMTLPRSPSTSGVIWAIALGSCPRKPKMLNGEPWLRVDGRPGERVAIHGIGPLTGDPGAAAGRSACVRFWTAGPGGRYGRRSITRTFKVPARVIPAPSALAVRLASVGRVFVTWKPSVVAFGQQFLAWQAGTQCPPSPDAADAEHQAYLGSTAEYAELYVQETGPVCFALWYQSPDGHLSAPVTTVFTMPAPPAPSMRIPGRRVGLATTKVPIGG